MRNLQPVLDRVLDVLKTHELEHPGEYTRWLWQNEANDRKLGLNEYGCADAANIIYMLGCFPADSQNRECWIQTLQSFQHSDTGLFIEATHHPYHTTAHCIAALELFEAKAAYPLKAMEPYLEKDKLYDLLEHLEWDENPWTASHQGAGIYAALVLQEEAGVLWQDWYFSWLYEHADPETGFWRKGRVKPILHGDSFTGVLYEPTIFPHLASSFHYLFNHEYAHRPLRFPERMIDTCLDIYRNRRWPTLGHAVSFAEIDWVYCLNRALRQSGYRFAECKSALHDFAADYVDYLESLNHTSHEGFNDLHTLFGCVCALSELQAALPGELMSDKPLKLVLDRRPFI